MMQTTKADLAQEMYAVVEELFPLCRSLTGDGVRHTLRNLQQIAPLKVHEIPTGTQVFDWTIPNEWNIRDAYVMDVSGNRVIDFQESNLHVLGYSIPFEGVVSLPELQEHLHSLPDRPDAIPYVTSYYTPRWGFCLAHRQRLQLKDGMYTVKIDATLEPGSMTYADLLIPGESTKEILISTYICHPSMANDQLSGPVVAAFLARELLSQPKRRYSYRFVFVPETIGSIAYLSQHLPHLKERVVGGYVMACVGDDKNVSYLSTRWGDRLVDRITPHILRHRVGHFRSYDWLQRGSDERQYNWPGVDLPIGSLMCTKYGEYPEYHTSDDNLDCIQPEALLDSLLLYQMCLDAFECNRTYQCTTLCEPQLGRRGLYPTLGTRDAGRTVRDLVNILAYSDSEKDLLSIAETLGKPIWTLAPLANQLVAHGLLREVP